MTPSTEEQNRIDHICRSLHEHIGTPAGRVFRDCFQPMILTEYRDVEIQTSWDHDEIKDLSDFALDDLICKRKVERLKDTQQMLQQEIDAIEKIWPCHSSRFDDLRNEIEVLGLDERSQLRRDLA